MPHKKDSNWVIFTLVFKEKRGMTATSKRARRVCDLRSDLYGRYLTRTALARATQPRRGQTGARAHCQSWFEKRGMVFHETPNPQICWVDGSRATVCRVFGEEANAWLRRSRTAPPRHRWPLPEDIAIHLKSISVSDYETHRLALEVKGLPSAGQRRPTRPAPLSASPTNVPGMTPAEVRAIYDFPAEWTGKSETIFLLNLGSRVDPEDLQAFWRSHNIDRSADLTEQIDLSEELAPVDPDHHGPKKRPKPQGFLQQLEPTMGAQWIGALAPAARLFIYNIDSEAVADPWAAFLAAAVTPDTKGRHPTILVSTWSLPERHYYARHGREVFADLLEQAAAIGVTMIAASGDWGVYDGRPASTIDNRQVAEAPWPHGVFPSVEDYVLSVGGTMITSRQPLTELAWSGPLPPNEQLRQFVPFFRLGSSGGFSEDVAIPWWQAEALSPKGVTRHFRRGLNLPAVLPSGRGYPDVALMAQGAAITNPSGEGLASMGFDAIVAGQRINYAGGTSVAAPIWSAIIACMNQARRASRLPRVGFVNPLLYHLANLKWRPERNPFRAITVGNSDVELRVVYGGGTPTKFLLEGFSAGTADGGWSPVTGLGVPNVRNLIEASTRLMRRGRPPR